jgi:ribonuclease HI
MATIDEDSLTIYTDGSSFSKPRRGGAGILLIHIAPHGYEVVEKLEVPGFKGATNNQMELYASIEALKHAIDHPMLGIVQRVVIRTDSQYITNNYLLALKTWPHNKWLNKDGRPIENVPLWKEFKKQFIKLNNLKRGRVRIEWVEGHAKDPYNKTADRLARASARGVLKKPLIPIELRRKFTKEMTQVGSVGILGQRVSIHIVSAQLLYPQRIYKYSYEVISKRSKYFEKKDIIFSRESLRVGHSYYVVLSNNPKNPEIKKVIREIKPKTIPDAA